MHKFWQAPPKDATTLPNLFLDLPSFLDTNNNSLKRLVSVLNQPDNQFHLSRRQQNNSAVLFQPWKFGTKLDKHQQDRGSRKSSMKPFKSSLYNFQRLLNPPCSNAKNAKNYSFQNCITENYSTKKYSALRISFSWSYIWLNEGWQLELNFLKIKLAIEIYVLWIGNRWD